MAEPLPPSLSGGLSVPGPSPNTVGPDHHRSVFKGTTESPIRRRPANSNISNHTTQADQEPNKATIGRVEQITNNTLYPTVQTSNDRTALNQKDPPHISLFLKLGILTNAIFIAGSLCILGAVGFLWFLWLADYHNPTWHHIVYNNWFTRCISLSGLVVRTAISLQSSAATSIVASLALEKTGVLLLHFASVSLTRHANSGPYMLAWWLLKAFIRGPDRWKNIILPTLITALTIIAVSIQFTTTALLSDVNSVVIPGSSNGMALATNFAYNINGSIPVVTRGSTWTMKPPFYPAFAEYHEDAPSTPDGVSDTGLTLRAFTPLKDQQSRTLLKDYQGRATVLDSRVVCMRPNLTSERAHVADSLLAFNGLFNAPFNASRLDYFTQNVNGTQPLTDWNSRPNTNFTCLAPLTFTNGINGDFGVDLSLEGSVWRMSFCQPFGLTSPGVLLSEFRNLEDAARYEIDGDWNYANGVAYLAINVSSGNQEEWISGLNEEDPEFGTITGPGYAPLAYSDHGEWLDLLFDDEATLRLSVSLCYTAFDTADLDVVMSGSTNRTEPAPTYDIEQAGYTYGAIRGQFGQLPNGQISQDNDSASSRGILNLQKRSSWLPSVDDYEFNGVTFSGGTSWITDFGNMGGPSVYGAVNSRIGYDTTAFLYNAYREPNSWTDIESINPDPSMISLVQEIVQNGGSVAFALQSIITILAGVAYYDQLQQFNDVSSITYSEFIVATARAKFRGLIGVSSVIAAHLLLMGVILCLFFVRVHLSTVGNSWQAVAQVNGELAKPLLETAAFVTDSKVEDLLKTKKWKTKMVGIAVLDDERGSKIIGMIDKYPEAAPVEEPQVAG